MKNIKRFFTIIGSMLLVVTLVACGIKLLEFKEASYTIAFGDSVAFSDIINVDPVDAKYTVTVDNENILKVDAENKLIEAIDIGTTKVNVKVKKENKSLDVTVVAKKLAKPVGSIASDVLTWTAVSNANGYIVTVGDVSVDLEKTVLSYDLTTNQSFEPGAREVKLAAKGNGTYYSTSDATSIKTDYKVVREVKNPTNFREADGKLIWDAVPGATSYVVKVGNGAEQTVTSPEVAFVNQPTNQVVTIKVKTTDQYYTEKADAYKFEYANIILNSAPADENGKYSENGSHLMIIGMKQEYAFTVKNLIIPDSIGGKNITGIDWRAFDKADERYKDYKNSENVLLKNSDFAFEEITLGANVKNIGHSAFLDQKKLKIVNINNSLKTIEYNVFMGASALTNINFNAAQVQLGGSVFEWTGDKAKVFTFSGTNIPTYESGKTNQYDSAEGFVFLLTNDNYATLVATTDLTVAPYKTGGKSRVTLATKLDAVETTLTGTILSWEASTYESLDVKYDIYVDGVKEFSTKELEFDLNNIPRGGTFKVTVVVSKTYFESGDHSNEEEITLEPIVATPNVTASEETGKLTWNEIENVTEYNVYLYNNETKVYDLVNTISATDDSDEDTTVSYTYSTNIAHHKYIIKAVGVDGYRDSYKAELIASTRYILVKPILSIENGNLVWNEIENATHYALYVLEPEATEYVLYGELLTQNSFALRVLETLGLTKLKLIAIHDEGKDVVVADKLYLDSPESEVIEYTVSKLPLPEFTNVALTANVLTWDSLGENVADYNIYVDGTKVGTVAGDQVTTYTFTDTETTYGPGLHLITIKAIGSGDYETLTYAKDDFGFDHEGKYAKVSNFTTAAVMDGGALKGYTLSWDAVFGATLYEVKISGVDKNVFVKTNSINLQDYPTDAIVNVRASIGDSTKAENGDYSDNFEYASLFFNFETNVDGKYIISGKSQALGESLYGTITIPATYQGIEVVEIKGSGFAWWRVHTLNINSAKMKIDWSLKNMKNLRTVNIYSNYVYFGNIAADLAANETIKFNLYATGGVANDHFGFYHAGAGEYCGSTIEFYSKFAGDISWHIGEFVHNKEKFSSKVLG